MAHDGAGLANSYPHSSHSRRHYSTVRIELCAADLSQPRANSVFDFICGSITHISRLDALDEHAEMFGDQFKVASSDGWRDFLDRAILMHDLPLRQLLPSLNHELRQAGEPALPCEPQRR